MTEKALQKAVIQLAHLLGWACAHFRPAMTRRGRWVTPVEADGKGWPDLVLVKPGRCLFRELKTDNGRLGSEQASWLERLQLAGQNACVWRTADWRSGRIEQELRQ